MQAKYRMLRSDAFIVIPPCFDLILKTALTFACSFYYTDAGYINPFTTSGC